MKPKDDLFLLIRSLAPVEKRYFKVFAGREQRNGRNNYVRLFDTIDAIPEYDEAAVKKALQTDAAIRNFAATKYQLYRLLLKSQYEFRAAKSPDIAAAEMICHTQTLQDKRLYDQALRMLAKAKRLANKHELLPLLLQILAQENRLLENSAAPNQIQRMSAIAAEEAEVHRKLVNQNEYSMLRAKITALRKTALQALTPAQLSELRDILAHPLLSDVACALSLQAQKNFFRIRAEALTLASKKSTAHEAYTQLMHLWSQRPPNDQTDRQRYRLDLVSHLNVCFAVQKFDEVEYTLARLKELRPASADEELKTFQSVVHIELLLHLLRADLAAGRAMASVIREGMQRFAGKLSTARTLTLLMNMGLINFLSGEWHAARDWMNAVPEIPEPRIRRDIRVTARLLMLLVHYELGNIGVLESMHRSLQRSLGNRAQEFPVVRLVLRALPAVLAAQDTAMRNRHLRTLHAKLLELDDVSSATPPGLTETLAWTESRFARLPISEVFGNLVAARHAERQG